MMLLLLMILQSWKQGKKYSTWTFRETTSKNWTEKLWLLYGTVTFRQMLKGKDQSTEKILVGGCRVMMNFGWLHSAHMIIFACACQVNWRIKKYGLLKLWRLFAWPFWQFGSSERANGQGLVTESAPETKYKCPSGRCNWIACHLSTSVISTCT